MLAAADSSEAVDITNRWVLAFDPPRVGLQQCVLDVQQVGTSFEASGSCYQSGMMFSGTVDTATGAFTGTGWLAPGPSDCTISGSPSPSGTTLAGAIECFGESLSFTAGLCQNGDVDPGEDCDTGFFGFLCCTPSCTTEPDGTACTTGSGCQTGEACSSGACVGTPRPQGDPCDIDFDRCTEDGCDGNGACVAGPCSSCCRELPGACVFDANCTRPLERSSVFSLTTASGTASDRLTWRLKSLADTAADEFGDPTTDTDVAICPYYVNELHGPTLLAAFHAPAGGTCGQRACWKRRRSGFGYRDRDARSDGLFSIRLKAGTGGAARIVAKGRGPNLPDWPGMPHPPLGVLLRSGANCWGAEYLTVDEQPGAIEAAEGQ
jgi:hypothetical protein